jgi:hypothetical protein
VPFFSYGAYGLALRSEVELPYPCGEVTATAEVELIESQSGLLRGLSGLPRVGTQGADRFGSRFRLSDGSDYLVWAGLHEFLVSVDGRRIIGYALNERAKESFYVYLLGQVLSYSLIKLGVEPLHATVVDIDGLAVAFVGDCGYGKSTLAAAFLRAGYPILTDDLLVVHRQNDVLWAYSGLPRLKLFPEIAQQILGTDRRSVPLNSLTSKLIIPLDRGQHCSGCIPLRVIYALRRPANETKSKATIIRRLKQRDAFTTLLKNTFNTVVVEPKRLECQFVRAAEISSRVPIRSLAYPRALARLPEVCETVLSDVARVVANEKG